MVVNLAVKKTSISIQENLYDEFKKQSEELGLKFNAYMMLALADYYVKNLLEMSGGKVVEIENPTYIPKVGKDSTKEVLDELIKFTAKINELDPLGLGKTMNEINYLYMKRYQEMESEEEHDKELSKKRFKAYLEYREKVKK